MCSPTPTHILAPTSLSLCSQGHCHQHCPPCTNCFPTGPSATLQGPKDNPLGCLPLLLTWGPYPDSCGAWGHLEGPESDEGVPSHKPGQGSVGEQLGRGWRQRGSDLVHHQTQEASQEHTAATVSLREDLQDHPSQEGKIKQNLTRWLPLHHQLFREGWAAQAQNFLPSWPPSFCLDPTVGQKVV